MKELDEFGRMALERLVNDLFTGKHFSICDLDKIIEITKTSVHSGIYKQLSAYHCVNFSDMSDREKELIQEKVVECLRGDPILNPCRVRSQLLDEGGDFTFTEDRYIDSAKRLN